MTNNDTTNQDKIWDIYQNDDAFIDSGCPSNGRQHYIARQIPKNSTVLNIGVGRGELEKILIDNKVNIFSLDPSKNTIEKLIKNLGMVDSAIVGYSQDIPFEENYFDFVIMSEVLEHLEDKVYFRTIAEVHRVLKSVGVFIGTVPANEILEHSMTICPCCENVFHRWGHEQTFTKNRIGQDFSELFDKVAVNRKYFGDLTKLNAKGKFVWVLKTIQSALDLKGGSQNFYFRASKG
jgi:ubiquinone/menaquinone biosynthesis C-methylase UbiE